MEFKGIDVSKWNGNINWDKVKSAGINFAIVREGYGKRDPRQVDKKFKDNINGAKSVGIHTSVYHYSYADSVEDAINEARFCLENIEVFVNKLSVAGITVTARAMLTLYHPFLTHFSHLFHFFSPRISP